MSSFSRRPSKSVGSKFQSKVPEGHLKNYAAVNRFPQFILLGVRQTNRRRTNSFADTMPALGHVAAMHRRFDVSVQCSG